MYINFCCTELIISSEAPRMEKPEWYKTTPAASRRSEVRIRSESEHGMSGHQT